MIKSIAASRPPRCFFCSKRERDHPREGCPGFVQRHPWWLRALMAMPENVLRWK